MNLVGYIIAVLGKLLSSGKLRKVAVRNLVGGMVRKRGVCISSFPAYRREKGSFPALIKKGMEGEQSHFDRSSNQISQIKPKVDNGFGSLF